MAGQPQTNPELIETVYRDSYKATKETLEVFNRPALTLAQAESLQRLTQSAACAALELLNRVRGAELPKIG